jgi:hypothetical protein
VTARRCDVGTFLIYSRQGNQMHPTVVSRLAKRWAHWSRDWIGPAFALAVILLISVGVFMSIAGSA